MDVKVLAIPLISAICMHVFLFVWEKSAMHDSIGFFILCHAFCFVQGSGGHMVFWQNKENGIKLPATRHLFC